MKYKLFGKSGLRVSEICLGTMTFGEVWGWGAPKDECKKMYGTFIEAGGNFIDTANRYTEGTSEKYVGEFIASERERIVLATKYSLKMRTGDPNSSGNHRKNLIQSLDASLKRLNTEYIDVYWIHAWDAMTPAEEVMRALDDVVRSGKVFYIGISDTPAWVVSQANTLAELRGWTPFVGLQIEYSLIQRTSERELLPMARSFDLAIAAWAPLAGGALTGKYLKQDDSEMKRLKPTSARLNERAITIAREVQIIADEIGCKSSHVALNWLRQKKGVIIPIIGARTASQLEENINYLTFSLTDDQMQRLDDVSKIELGFPHDFLTSDVVRDILYSGLYASIENHRR